MDLVSHTTYVVCVNFIYKWRRLRTTDIFVKLFIAILYTLRHFARNLLRGNRRRSTFFYFILILMSGLGLDPWLYV